MKNIKTVTKKQFYFHYGPRAKRLWNHVDERGIAIEQVKNAPFTINDITHWFCRNDGWVIGCTDDGVDSCHALWPNEWLEIVRIENN